MAAMHNPNISQSDKPQPALTVSQLNRNARNLLEDVFARVRVEGEISNLSRPASGHIYFTLKDDKAQIRCAFFRGNALRCRQQLADGSQIMAIGRISLYEARGDYQLIVEQVEAAGEGALRAAFDALKQRLLAEGLFAAQNKQQLPNFPASIAVVTSPTGAVWQDIRSVFARRAPHVALTLVPTPVQGSDACAQIIRALQLADRGNFDAIILARGGGSLEDLWCFNEEALARAIAACSTPVVSAVGHETDTSISDFVADVRAPTPTAAAELLAPDRNALLERINHMHQRLQRLLQQQLSQRQQQTQSLAARLRHPRERLEQGMLRLDELTYRLQLSLQQQLGRQQQQTAQLHNRLKAQHPQRTLQQNHNHLLQLHNDLQRAASSMVRQKRQELQHSIHKLALLSPLEVLQRGYSILRTPSQEVIVDSNQVKAGDKLHAKLKTGSLLVQVMPQPATKTSK